MIQVIAAAGIAAALTYLWASAHRRVETARADYDLIDAPYKLEPDPRLCDRCGDE